MEDTDMEPYGACDLKVEIAARAGDIHGVCLTTLVSLPDYRDPKARVKLREVITLLRDCLPVTELRQSDQSYQKESPDLGVAVDGKLTVVPKNLAATRAAQEDLKRKLGEKSDAIREPPAKP